MYKDIITYKLAEGVTEDNLLTIAKEIVDSWMSKQKGFIKWEIHNNNNNTFTDIVYWESKKDAKESEKDMINIPKASEWFACYEEGSIVSLNLNLVREFK